MRVKTMKKWFIALLILSLLVNGYFLWKLYYPHKPTQEQIVAYDNSITLLKDAQQYVQNAAKTTGKERNSALFNAFQCYESAEIFLTQYRQKFKALGINADTLSQALVMNRGEMINNTSHAINGQPIELNGISAVLDDIVSKLPASYENSSIEELRAAFGRLKYY
jgi:nitric oxide reductase large subunit